MQLGEPFDRSSDLDRNMMWLWNISQSLLSALLAEVSPSHCASRPIISHWGGLEAVDNRKAAESRQMFTIIPV
jgi:hypothetical protein